jgi:hypothetical protein
MAKKVPNLGRARAQYAVNRQGEDEGVWYPLYDSQLYPAAGAAVLTFFQVPVGGNRGGVVLTEEDTNMTNQGVLPAPQRFLMTGIEIFIHSGLNPYRAQAAAGAIAQWNDLHAVHRRGFARLFIGSKDYLKDGPIGVFPPSFRLAGDAALGGVGSAAGNVDMVDYASLAGKPYEIAPFFIETQQNFRVTLEFPNGAVPLPSTNATTRVGVRLLGFLYRQSQ